MDFALVDLPDWVPAPADPGEQTREDLRTPFGVYMLLHDLAGPARQRLGSDKLIAWWAGRVCWPTHRPMAARRRRSGSRCSACG